MTVQLATVAPATCLHPRDIPPADGADSPAVELEVTARLATLDKELALRGPQPSKERCRHRVRAQASAWAGRSSPVLADWSLMTAPWRKRGSQKQKACLRFRGRLRYERRAPGSLLPVRAAGARLRRSGTCRASLDGMQKARPRRCWSVAVHRSRGRRPETKSPLSPLAQKPRSSSVRSTVMVKES